MKRLSKIIVLKRFLTLLLFIFCGNIYAQENISGYLNKNEIFIGDTVDFTVVAQLEQDAQLSVNQNFIFDGFDILSSNIEHITSEKNIYKLHFKLLACKLGDIFIDSIPVFFISSDGTNNLFFTPKTEIVVKGVLEQNGNYDIKDIKALKKIKVKTVYVLLIFTVIILVILCVYALVYSYINRPKLVVIDPQTDALNKLSLLYENRNDIKVKDFYYKMSEILRIYVSEKYNFYALEMTTSEFLKKMKPLLPNSIAPLEFKKYLSVFNLAKYSSFTPNEAEIKRNYDFTKNLLELL
ncbi:MAG: hypothetical protein LBD57_00285 [Endomicrobium sp.]|jgi:hypothetical protein|uniref:hypothetical protein n=1 Tax=Candidatus Endomicrobiellum cubanum TaxID=3242325 RepID=UPI00281D4F61|nr:hypothetical protein [Endomicrobium sp.]